MIELVAELGLEPIRVGARRLDSSETGFVKVLFEVEGVRPDKLWFAVDSDYADWVSDSYDAVAVALLLPAMMAGRSLVLDGPVSARLYWSITSQVIPLLAQFFPATKRIEVIAAGNAPPTRGNAVVTGFSAGVDSFNVVLDHHAVDSVPESLRLTHLLFNDVGSHGRRRKGDLVERRWDGVARAAATLSLPLIRTHSNVNAFYGRVLV